MTINYCSWIAEVATVNCWPSESTSPDELETRDRRIQAVQTAVASLPRGEQAIIRSFFFDGLTMPQIADDLGIGLQTAMNLYTRALRQMRKQLKSFAISEFNLPGRESACVICSSPHRNEIEKILAGHIPGQPYRDCIRSIRQRFNLTIVSVMTIIGHRKYHS